jgi:hypothetical protein
MEKRNKAVMVFFTEEEKEKLIKGAEENFTTLSGLVRTSVIEKLNRERAQNG